VFPLFLMNPDADPGRDMLRFATAFALRGARKLVRGLRQGLTEDERYRVADDVVQRFGMSRRRDRDGDAACRGGRNISAASTATAAAATANQRAEREAIMPAYRLRKDARHYLSAHTARPRAT
jgi:hypothetical protein